MGLTEQLTDYVHAAFSGIWIHTSEPDEAERDIVRHARRQRWRVAAWDLAQGLRLPAPADRFETRGIVYQGNEFQGAAKPEQVDGDQRQGLGCCPGIVRGPVRVVTDPRGAVLQHGDILVAERTDPGWIMLFPSAAGLLVERGSLLSHSAIVAREMGIPAVVALTGVTRWLKDGDWVELDGRTGLVTRIQGNGAAHGQ